MNVAITAIAIGIAADSAIGGRFVSILDRGGVLRLVVAPVGRDGDHSLSDPGKRVSCSADRTDAPVVSPALDIRIPTAHDAAAIWRLVDRCRQLDTNSCYAYLLLCTDFSETCLVADAGHSLAGFVAGYVPPNRPDVLFVWQVGVAPDARGQGLGRKLLRRLLDSKAGRAARYLEATVTPGNQASGRLFQSLANELGCELSRAPHFAVEHFAGGQHEEELLIRIGPLKPCKE